MTAIQGTSTDRAFATLESAVTAAKSALAGDSGRPLDAVAWLSAHLAAVEQTVVPAARALDADRRATREVRRRARSLQAELRWLEQLHSGDALVAGLNAVRQRDAVLAALDDYLEAE